jgi:DNA-binding Lrp family transcriptional regulator
MIGFLLSVIIIAIYEAGRNFEKFDVFKVLYITLMVFAILIILFVSYEAVRLGGELIYLNGFVYLILFSVSISFLYIGINKDSYSKREITSINENKYYKIPRFLIKMSFSFLIGTLLMIPFLMVLNFLPIFSDFRVEIILFFNEFPNIFLYMGQWEILYLIIFSTIIPYLLVYLANVNWKSANLTYSQWSSILNLIDPMGSIILSVIFVNEFFPFELMITFIFLILISIILRYAHEVKNMVNAFLLITLRKGVIGLLPVKLLKNYGIIAIHSLIGSHDLLINIKISSIKDFYYLVDKKLKSIDDIKKVEIFFVNKMEKIT